MPSNDAQGADYLNGQAVLQEAISLHGSNHPVAFAEQEHLLLAAIVNASDDAILSKTLDGIITSWNPAAQRMFGYTAEEIIGRHKTVLFPLDRLFEEDLILDRLQHGIATDHFETIRLHKDGTVLYVSVTISPIKDRDGRVFGASTIARNITERKQAEDALRQSEDQLRQQARLLDILLDNVPIGIAIAEPPDLTVRKVSRYGEAVFGIDTIKIMAHPPEETPWVIYKADGVTPAARAELPLTRATQQGEEIRGEEWVLVNPQTGQSVVLLCNASPVCDDEGNIVYGILAWSDITALKAAQEEIGRLNERLQMAITESSHRIKNQLQILCATADIVLMDNQEVVAADELLRLRSQIRAVALTHDLLTSQTRAEGTADHISLKALLERMLAAIQETTGRHRLQYTLDDAPVPLKLATSLALLLNEAVSNAIKHGSAEVEVTLKVAMGQGQLEVCDDGPGFPDGFDARRAANTGLELLLTLTQTDLRGTVEFTNRSEGGARVVVTFPLLSES